jgi:hypothetical protein
MDVSLLHSSKVNVIQRAHLCCDTGVSREIVRLESKITFDVVVDDFLLNFRLQQCAGSHQSIKGLYEEDTDLIIILILRGHGPIICSGCQL